MQVAQKLSCARIEKYRSQSHKKIIVRNSKAEIARHDKNVVERKFFQFRAVMFFCIDVEDGASDDEKQNPYDGGHGSKSFDDHAGGSCLRRIHGDGRCNDSRQSEYDAEIALNVLPLFRIAESCCGEEKEGHHHSSGKDNSAQKKEQGRVRLPDTKKGNDGAGRFAKTADEGAAEKNHFYRLCVFKNSEQKKKRERHIE